MSIPHGRLGGREGASRRTPEQETCFEGARIFRCAPRRGPTCRWRGVRVERTVSHLGGNVGVMPNAAAASGRGALAGGDIGRRSCNPVLLCIRRHLRTFVADSPRRFGAEDVGRTNRAACGMGPSPRAARGARTPVGASVLVSGRHGRAARLVATPVESFGHVCNAGRSLRRWEVFDREQDVDVSTPARVTGSGSFGVS